MFIKRFSVCRIVFMRTDRSAPTSQYPLNISPEMRFRLLFFFFFTSNLIIFVSNPGFKREYKFDSRIFNSGDLNFCFRSTPLLDYLSDPQDDGRVERRVKIFSDGMGGGEGALTSVTILSMLQKQMVRFAVSRLF